MLAKLILAIRSAFRSLGNRIRILRRVPEYVIFTLEGEYPEYAQPAENLLMRYLRPPRVSLQRIGEQFRVVAGDPRVRGVILHLRPLQMEMARLESLRSFIKELRTAGKMVVTWATYYTNASYYVACAADEVLLQPGGRIDPMGLRITSPYFADALARVGIKADFHRTSAYKTAPDAYMSNEMSQEEREMITWLLDASFDELVTAISKGRRITDSQARSLIDNTPCMDIKAVEIGAVDHLVHEDDLPEHLKVRDKVPQVATWESIGSRLLRQPLSHPGRYVALVTIEGTIIDGESGRPPVRPPVQVPVFMEPRAGDISVVQTVRRALRDRRAAAVVLYVNSRGGTITASEAMRAALEKVSDMKPLVVSMGPMAASGAYWISTPANHIMAQPSTFTGSIGVIIGKLVIGGLMDWLQVKHETISRGKFATIYDGEKAFTEEEQKLIQEDIDWIYDLFIDRVSTGRDMEREAVDAVGKGRVWTGRQALENGLVDELGGLEQAIVKARELAGLHERAPVRLITPGKQAIAPAPNLEGTVSYIIDGLHMFQSGLPLCICLLDWDDSGGGFS